LIFLSAGEEDLIIQIMTVYLCGGMRAGQGDEASSVLDYLASIFY